MPSCGTADRRQNDRHGDVSRQHPFVFASRALRESMASHTRAGHTGPSQEALARKTRTEAALKLHEVPVLDTLPVIVDSKSAHARTLDEVIERLLVVGRIQGLGCSEPSVRAGMAPAVREEMKRKIAISHARRARARLPALPSS